jgi:hypothetical protein
MGPDELALLQVLLQSGYTEEQAMQVLMAQTPFANGVAPPAVQQMIATDGMGTPAMAMSGNPVGPSPMQSYADDFYGNGMPPMQAQTRQSLPPMQAYADQYDPAPNENQPAQRFPFSQFDLPGGGPGGRANGFIPTMDFENPPWNDQNAGRPMRSGPQYDGPFDSFASQKMGVPAGGVNPNAYMEKERSYGGDARDVQTYGRDLSGDLGAIIRELVNAGRSAAAAQRPRTQRQAPRPTTASRPGRSASAPGQMKKAAGVQSAKSFTPAATRATTTPTKARTVAPPAPAKVPPKPLIKSVAPTRGTAVNTLTKAKSRF